MEQNNRGKYSQELKLEHNELPAKVNVETGEVNMVKPKVIKYTGASEFTEIKSFHKVNDVALEWLTLKLSNIELKVVMVLILKAKTITNSLEPLSDALSVRQLAEELQIGHSKVTPILDKLFALGVYGKFEITEKATGYKKYWILNPYLSVKSAHLRNDVQSLFVNTELAIAVKMLEKTTKD